MKLLDRHIGSYVIWGTALTLVVLVGLFTITEFIEDLEKVGRGNYTMVRALEYMLLRLPGRMFQLFPEAALIGSLMGLGALASNSELIVVRASGVSVARIILSVMKAGALLMVIALIVGEGLAPICEKLAQKKHDLALGQQIALRAGQGFWLRDGATFINIRKMFPDERMSDVYIYEFDEQQRLRVSTYASHAHYEGDQWVLEDIKQSELHPDRVENRTSAKAVLQSVFEPELVEVITEKPESLSALGLFRYLRYLQDNELSTTRYELALWGKLISPLATGVMIFLAIPLVLGRLRTAGIGQRIVVGIFVGLAFYVAQQTAVQMGIVYGLTPFLSAIAPTAFFFMVGLWLTRQVR